MNVLERVAAFYADYNGEKRIYGMSEENLPLYALRAGEGFPVVLAQCAMHAREYVTAALGLMFAAFYAENPPPWTLWTVPLANPDGVRIAEEGADWLSPARRAAAGEMRRGRDYGLYKANADGVDLNVNFDANWGTGASNVFSPDFENFVGPRPFSAKESAALAAFTREIKPDGTLSFHAKGEVLYWEFFQRGAVRERDRRIAEKCSAACGYPTGDAGASAGGYKDWCVQKLGIPALTVEVGSDKLSHPVDWARAEGIFRQIKDVVPAFAAGIREEEG